MKIQSACGLLLLGVFLPGIAFGSTQITAWGDSLTGGGSSAWPAQLTLLTGLRMNARGVGGETSTQIKDRFLAESARWGDITIIWAGRNNSGSPATVKADVATMVSNLTTTNYVVLGVTNGSSSSEWIGASGYVTITGLNSDLGATYGSRFIDIRKILVDSYNPSLPQDVIDFGHDTLPSSLRGDAIHLNGAGHLIVANAINAAIVDYIPYSPDTKWAAGITGDWNTPGNWTNGLPQGVPVDSSVVPVAGNALIRASATAYTVSLNSPATSNDLTIYSLTGSLNTVTTLNVNSALTTTGINQTGTPAGRFLTGGNPTININSGGSVNLGAQVALSGGTLNVKEGATFVWGNTCSNQGFQTINSTVNVFGSLAGTTGGYKGSQGLTVEGGGGNSVMDVPGGTVSVDSLTVLTNCGNGTLTIRDNGSFTVRNNAKVSGITLGNIWNTAASSYANVSSLNLSGGTITNGTVGLLKISSATVSSNTRNSASVNISGGTFRQFATTYIGSGRNGSLNVSGGDFLSDGDILAGGTANTVSSAPVGVTASGTIAVSGGALTATNIKIGDGSLSPLGGTFAAWNSPGILNISGGALTALSLSATNTNGTFHFTGGTLTTSGTNIANGSEFRVGEGTLPAMLRLNGGSHAFANGLTIADNSTLTGSGTITGNVSVSGIYGAQMTSIGSPSAGLISVTGSIALQNSSALHVTDTAVAPTTLPIGSTLTLLQCTGSLTGTFAGLAEGNVITVGPNVFVIHYTPTSVTLQATPPSYASWAFDHGVSGEPQTGDPDQDGLENTLEYALGLHPFQHNPTPHSQVGNVLTFTKGADAHDNGDVTYLIEQSEDLVNWVPVVTHPPSNDSTSIGYALPDGLPKVFARLRVILAP